MNQPTTPATTGGSVFGRNPSLWITAVAATLGVGTAVGAPGLSQHQVAAIFVALNAIAAVVTAMSVRPIAPAVYTNLVAAAAALVAAYGFNISSETVGAVDAAVLAVLALVMRGQVSPKGALTAVEPAAPPPVVAVTGHGTPTRYS